MWLKNQLLNLPQMQLKVPKIALDHLLETHFFVECCVPDVAEFIGVHLIDDVDNVQVAVFP